MSGEGRQIETAKDGVPEDFSLCVCELVLVIGFFESRKMYNHCAACFDSS